MDLSLGSTHPLIPRFRRLYLTPPQPQRHRRNQRTPPIPCHPSLPTWAQLTALSMEAASLVAEQGTPRSPSVMFVAMKALLSRQVPMGQSASQKKLFTYEGNNDLRLGEETYVNRDWRLVYHGIKVSDNISSPQFPKLKRERCRPSNQSLDPSPPLKLCYPTQEQDLSYTLSTGFTLFNWSAPFHEAPGGWSTPIFTTPSGYVHSSLWKLFTAITPSLVRSRFRSTSYPTQRTVYVQACVASPYALLYGVIKIAENNGHYSITCSACTLTNCLDSTVFSTLILAIVSIVATAATAAVSLANSVQNAVYVNHLARNISVAMGTQMDIDKKLETKLNVLEETVTILGDKLYNMQTCMTLRCHVDFKYICVTNTPYNDTEWQWPLIKTHLQGIWTHNNLSFTSSNSCY
ncbi:envelope glycoprotein [Plecturocebus cupreus]